jgi:hypothetical protein
MLRSVAFKQADLPGEFDMSNFSDGPTVRSRTDVTRTVRWTVRAMQIDLPISFVIMITYPRGKIKNSKQNAGELANLFN